MQRTRISSGSPWEPVVGYSRAVRVGDRILVSGTTAVDEGGEIVGRGDLYAQTAFILQKIAAAIEQAGGGMGDVVRTRMYVIDIDRWEEAARAHGEFFGEIRPAATMVEVRRLIDPDLLIEIEAEAIVG